MMQPSLFDEPQPARWRVVEDYTPVHKMEGGVWVKRDDLYGAYGAPGGKARTCLRIAMAHRGKTLVTAGSRGSPQVHIVALIAKGLGVACRVHVPAAKQSYPELELARELGAEVVEHRPGYNSVIAARAKADAINTGAAHIPFGMECVEAVEETAGQCGNLPVHAARIVVPVGSGMSLAGIIRGVAAKFLAPIPILGVVVGASPTKRLDKYAPHWRNYCTLVRPQEGYSMPAKHTSWWGIELDPHYEAKAAPFVKPGDLFWVVGIRPRLQPDG